MKRWMDMLSCVLLVKPVMPLLEYAINKDYIAEMLCVNKDRAEKECQGRSYLMDILMSIQSFFPD